MFLTSSLRHRVLIPGKHGDLSILARPLGVVLHNEPRTSHRILVHDQLGRGQFAQHPGRGPKLDAMGADDLTVDRARYDDRRRLDFGGNHRVFADRHFVRAGDFTLEPTVDPRRPLEVALATHPGTLAQIIAVLGGSRGGLD